VDEKAGTQEDLNFTICSISDPNLSGQGNDSCGTFAIYGTVCGDDVQFRKKYEESYGAAVYHGKLITNRDQAAIVGKWQLKADSSVCGPFQLTRGEVSQNERLRSRSPPRLVQQNMFKQLQAQSSAWLPSADHYEIVSLFKQIHSKVAADARFYAACSECLSGLQTMCTKLFSGPAYRIQPFDSTPDVQLDPFGSTQQQLALKSSDVDIRLWFKQFEVRGQESQIEYLKAVVACLTERYKVEGLINAAVPVLRLKFDGWLDVDLSMALDGHVEELTALQGVDVYIVALLGAAVDDGARCFVRLVKCFAKAHYLVNAHGGYLNSTSWVFLAIIFLQHESCLPTYEQLEADDMDFSASTLWPVRLTTSTFCRFFYFVNKLGSGPHKLSVMWGTARRAHCRSWSGSLAHPLFIEHPRDSSRNVAICLKPFAWKETLNWCAWAEQSLSRSPRSRAVCGEVRGHCSTVLQVFGDLPDEIPIGVS